MARRFELTRVALRNFKSIVDCDVELGTLNVLVGPNTAGKSNFLDGLQFLADALNDGVDAALGRRGGLSLIRRREAGAPKPVSIEIEARLDGSSAATFRVSLLENGPEPYSFEEYCGVTDASGELLSEYTYTGGTIVGSFQAVMPLPGLLALAVHRTRLGLDVLFAGLSGYATYAINPTVMRAPRPRGDGRSLDRDGANIAGVLNRVERTDPLVLSDIEDHLRVIAPSLIGVRPLVVSGFEAIEFLQRMDGSDRPAVLQAVSASDGTLRALGVLTAVLGTTHSNVPPPLGIEEPEAGLHPAAAAILLEAFRAAADERQVFVTTHSPELLDSPLLRTDEVLAVRLVDGATEIAPIDGVGRQAIEDDLFTAGELLRADQLFPDGLPTASRASR